MMFENNNKMLLKITDLDNYWRLFHKKIIVHSGKLCGIFDEVE
jgi:hypothetical protein